MLTRSSLAADLAALGLCSGDIVMVHASLRAVGEVAGGPDEVHLAIRDVITDRGAGDIVPMENYTRPATPAEAALGEDAYAVHAHAVIHLNITDVAGVAQTVLIPAGLGDFVDPDVNDTGPRIHTHSDDTSVIHMHDLDPHVFTLGEFFRGWGVTISATNVGRYQAARGHTLTVTVTHGNGSTETIEDPYTYVIQGGEMPADGDQIVVTYV